MTQRVAFNPTETPVVVDDEGHTIAGLDWRDVDTNSPQVKDAVESGRLVWPELPQFDVSGSAQDVLDRVGDDPVKAQAAIVAEQAQDKPRSTLLADLQKITEKGND